MVSNGIHGIFGSIGFWLFIPFVIIIIISSLIEVSLYDLFLIIFNKAKAILMRLLIFGKSLFKKIKNIFEILKNWKINKLTKIEISKPEESEINIGS